MPSALPLMEQQLLKQPKPDVTEGKHNDPPGAAPFRPLRFF